MSEPAWNWESEGLTVAPISSLQFPTWLIISLVEFAFHFCPAVAAEVFARALGWVCSYGQVFVSLCRHNLFPALKTVSLSVTFLPRKCTEVSSAGPKAQGSSTQPKLVLSPCFLRCCSDQISEHVSIPSVMPKGWDLPTHPHLPTGAWERLWWRRIIAKPGLRWIGLLFCQN